MIRKLNTFHSIVNPSIVPIDTTLNTFIRSYARLTGTKFMCLEGGCGVCLVNITGLKTSNNEPRSIAVNSVRFFYNLKIRNEIYFKNCFSVFG